MRRHAVESVKGRLLLGVAPQDAHVHPGVAQIRTDFRAGYRNETYDPGILCRFSEEGSYLDTDRFGDAVRSTRVTQKPLPLT